jgi:hypothetical protein
MLERDEPQEVYPQDFAVHPRRHSVQQLDWPRSAGLQARHAATTSAAASGPKACQTGKQVSSSRARESKAAGTHYPYSSGSAMTIAVEDSR